MATTTDRLSADESSELRRLRVLIVVQNMSYTFDTRVQNIARTLVRSRFSVHVLCPRYPGDPRSSTREGVKIRFFRLPLAARGLVGHLLEYTWSLVVIAFLTRAKWSERRFDLVHICNPPDFFFLFARFCRTRGARVIFDQHDRVPELFQARYGQRRLMIKLLTLSERLTVANADHVLVTSDAALERMVSLDAVDRNAVTVLPNCPDLTRIPPHGQRYSQDGRITVGYLGNMNPQDRVDILLHAAHHIRYRLGRRDVVFVCIGNGSSYKDLLSLRAQLGVSDAVEFLGRRLPNVAWARLADCDMCVQPDPPNAFTSQTMMAKTSEYMALRKPIVTFDLPETRNVCGSAARYARGNSAPALAEEIVRLADDPELRAKLGSLARSRAEQCFNWRRYEGRLLDAYGYAHTSVEDIENPAAQVVLNGKAGSRVQRWRKIGEVRGLRNRL